MKSLLKLLVPPHWRPMGIVRELVRSRTNRQVAAGPFAGMRYVDDATGSAYVPKLLGIYERELYPTIEQIIAEKVPHIIDIGAAEGYYAVGLAWRLSGASVDAFELTERGRSLLSEMARLNGVADRVHVLGACDVESLNKALSNPGTSLVICDVEGFEQTLLQPEIVPGLRTVALLVELHDFAVRGIGAQLRARFEATHEIEEIWSEERNLSEFPYRSLMTRLLPEKYIQNSISEHRPERMSWLWLRPRLK